MTIPDHVRPIAPNKNRRFPAEPLTAAEVQALLDRCSRRAPSGIRNRAAITLLYYSGLRVSELIALRPSDVDLDKHSIRLRKTKSGQPQTRGFAPAADDALARWFDCRPRGATLFCTLQGGPISAEYVRQFLHRLGRQAGIGKRVHPHGLRHSYAVELERAGVPVTVISSLLGHSSVAVTSRYLQHMTQHQAIAVLVAADLPVLSC